MFRSVALPSTINGKLFLHSMPGKIETWNTFEEFAQIAHLDLIVSLTSIEEITKHSPAYANAILTKSLPCFRIEYAIDDYNYPQEKTKFLTCVKIATKKIQDGESVLVHCQAGIGRTGYFASCILYQLGFAYKDIAQLIYKAGSAPIHEERLDFYIELPKITEIFSLATGGIEVMTFIHGEKIQIESKVNRKTYSDLLSILIDYANGNNVVNDSNSCDAHSLIFDLPDKIYVADEEITQSSQIIQAMARIIKALTIKHCYYAYDVAIRIQWKCTKRVILACLYAVCLKYGNLFYPRSIFKTLKGNDLNTDNKKMSFRAINLPNTINGKLFLHGMPGAIDGMPGTIESWEKFEYLAQKNQLKLIVCLNSMEEIQEYSPYYFTAINANTLPCSRIEYAIKHNGLASKKIKFITLVQSVANQIKAGDAILVHCRHGITRTGFFVNCVVEQLGIKGDDAAKLVFRAGSMPKSHAILDYYQQLLE